MASIKELRLEISELEVLLKEKKKVLADMEKASRGPVVECRNADDELFYSNYNAWRLAQK